MGDVAREKEKTPMADLRQAGQGRRAYGNGKAGTLLWLLGLVLAAATAGNWDVVTHIVTNVVPFLTIGWFF